MIIAYQLSVILSTV